MARILVDTRVCLLNCLRSKNTPKLGKLWKFLKVTTKPKVMENLKRSWKTSWNLKSSKGYELSYWVFRLHCVTSVRNSLTRHLWHVNYYTPFPRNMSLGCLWPELGSWHVNQSYTVRDEVFEWRLAQIISPLAVYR